MATPKKSSYKKHIQDGHAYYYANEEFYKKALDSYKKNSNNFEMIRMAEAIIYLRENRIVKMRYDMERLLDSHFKV